MERPVDNRAVRITRAIKKGGVFMAAGCVQQEVSMVCWVLPLTVKILAFLRLTVN